MPPAATTGDQSFVPDDEPFKRRPSREEMRRIHLRRRAVLAAVVGGIALVIAVVASTPGEQAGQALSVATEPAEADAAAVAAAQARDERTVARVLEHTPYVTRGGPGRRRVALTFDDGPGPDTHRILEILDQHGASATFFNLGIQTAQHPSLAMSQLLGGHAVGGHTNDHARMDALPRRAQRKQLHLQDEAFSEAGFPRPRLFRPPYGSFDRATIELLERSRSLMVLWSIDTGDFASPGADTIHRRALEGIEPGAIILMHDGPGPRPQTVEALPRILRGLEARNLESVTVPELLRTNPPPWNQPPPEPLDGPG